MLFLSTTIARTRLLQTTFHAQHIKFNPAARSPYLISGIIKYQLAKMSSSHLKDDCIFCKIISGQFSSHKLIETEHTFAFLDIQPLAEGHTLVIPKYHAQFAQQLPDEYLSDILPVAKKVAIALGLDGEGANQWNILQNNGPRAHQVVPHVHFHIIPKPTDEEGLVVGWPAQKPSQEELKAVADRVRGKL